MKFILLTTLLTASAVGTGSPVDVGGISIEIPAPANFTRVIPDMSKVNALQSEFVPPGNDQLAAFISQEDAPAALADEIPNLTRRFTVQVATKIKAYSVSEGEFLQLKAMFKDNNEKLISDAKDKLTEPLAKASANVSKQLDTELSLKVSSIAPFPAHIDNDRMLAFSILAKNEIKTAEGTHIDISTNTTTLLYVNHRILFLYSYGGKDDLEWTREQSKEWASSILGANHDSAQTTPISAHRNGINWARVVDKAIVGGLLGLILALIGWATNRRKEN